MTVTVQGPERNIVITRNITRTIAVQSSGVSNLVGTVRYDVAQSMTSPEKLQAWANITGIPLGLSVDSASPTLTLTQIGAGLALYTTGGITAGAFAGPLTGNASSATVLATPRAINGVSFDGSAAITVTASAGTLTGSTLNATVTGSSLTTVGTLVSLAVTGAVSAGSFAGPLTGNVTGDVSGNAGTVTNGVYTSGSYADPAWITSLAGSKVTGAIAGTAAAGTLTGTTLAANVVASSLTSVGTLTSLTTSGQITSSLSTGTAPFSVASTTNVANLNASSLSGATFAAPGTIGGGTPGAATFTTLAATGTGSIGGVLTVGNNGTNTGYAQVVGGAGQMAMQAIGPASDVAMGLYAKGTSPAFVVVRGSISLYCDNPASAVDYLSISGSTAALPGLYGAGASTNVNLLLVSKGTGGIYATTNGGTTQFAVVHMASAVNYLQTQGSVTGSPATLTVQGTDTNAGAYFAAKGTSSMRFATGGGDQFQITPTTNATNYLQVTGGPAAGFAPYFSAQGSDTNIGIAYQTKGTFGHDFYAGGNRQFVVANVASAVNCLTVYGSATGQRSLILMGGSDTNSGVNISAKGTGDILFTGGSASYTLFQVNGSAAGAVNYFRVSPATTGNAPQYDALGGDTNVGYHVSTKGNAPFRVFTGSYTSEGLRVTHVASAVNYFNVFGAATTGSVYVGTAGSDANAGLVLYSKGSGALGLYTNSAGNPVALFAHTASTANFWQFYGSAAGGALAMYAGGSDANIGIVHTAKGTGNIAMYGNGGSTILFRASGVASSVNYINVFPSATGGGPTIYAGGTDANINCNHSLQGSGSHIFYTGSTSVIQFSVSHTASAVNRLEITGSATGNAIAISTAGSDANRSITFTTAGTGTVRFSNKIYPGTPAAATQTAAGISGGTGAPSNADASDGDFYFRSDGGALTSIYHKRAGAWVGIV